LGRQDGSLGNESGGKRHKKKAQKRKERAKKQERGGVRNAKREGKVVKKNQQGSIGTNMEWTEGGIQGGQVYGRGDLLLV